MMYVNKLLLLLFGRKSIPKINIYLNAMLFICNKGYRRNFQKYLLHFIHLYKKLN